MNRWQRLGRVFDPSGLRAWMLSHAALPTIAAVDRGIVRAMVAGRDAQGRSQIGVATFTLDEPRLLDLSAEPILSYGALGTFDDRGVLPSCLMQTDKGWFLYYTGVMLGRTVPFYFSVGLATSSDGYYWERFSPAPILERTAVDPYLTASPCVLFDDGRFRMWYVSASRWSQEEGQPKHYYHIRYAESSDGLKWTRDGIVCIDFKPGEYAIARPSVVRDADCYRMWYPYRGERYRIGYAESHDGILWERKDDEAIFEGPRGDWETEMQCYPAIFDTPQGRYMAYNGNAYGASGFGLAVQRRYP